MHLASFSKAILNYVRSHFRTLYIFFVVRNSKYFPDVLDRFIVWFSLCSINLICAQNFKTIKLYIYIYIYILYIYNIYILYIYILYIYNIYINYIAFDIVFFDSHIYNNVPFVYWRLNNLTPNWTEQTQQKFTVCFVIFIRHHH